MENIGRPGVRGGEECGVEDADGGKMAALWGRSL